VGRCQPAVDHERHRLPYHSDDHTPDQVAPEPKPSDSDEALRLITDYADGLREYIEKLRRNLN
jgi:hypothetical protein